jgi:hypothetical protein
MGSLVNKPKQSGPQKQEGHLQRGITFEESVMNWLASEDAQKNPLFAGGCLDSDMKFEDLCSLLTNQPNGVYYAPQCILEGSLLSIKLELKGFIFNRMKPDILKIIIDEKRTSCTVIDIKSSIKSKASHQLQVTAYASLIQLLAPSWLITEGEIWLPSDPYNRVSVQAAGPRRDVFSIQFVEPFFNKLCSDFEKALLAESLEVQSPSFGSYLCL